MWVDLSDGRTWRVPLAEFPSLMRATPAERENVHLSRVGLHWEELDQDISVAGLLADKGDPSRKDHHGHARRRLRAHRAG
jgi:hypothetical protein